MNGVDEELTKIKVNAGNKGVEKEDEDHHSKDRDTLHQQDSVGYPVLWKQQWKKRMKSGIWK